VTIPHEPWLVVLSIAIAIQGSFVGLSLAVGIDASTGLKRRLALAGSALSLATGVWSMHFVGMLAARFPSAIDYLALPTLTSFLICVIVVGLGVYIVHASGLGRSRIALGALAMGLGISTMHYVGMSAVHLAGPIRYEPSLIAASVAVSIAASAFALLALGSRPNRVRLFIGALALGLAISGMHYTAMAGMRLDPLCFSAGRFVEVEPALSRNTLALLATVISFGVSGAFLLSLVPDVRTAAPRLAAGPGALAEAAGVAIPIAGAEVAAAAGSAVEPPRPPLARVRVEKDGRPLFLPVEEICAVRANAHYTYVHDGEREYFCNQSISALEAALDRSEFFRVHRSHIVRLARVARVRKAGEAAVAELAAPAPFSVPIARGHYRAAKQRIEALPGAGRPAFRAIRQQS